MSLAILSCLNRFVGFNPPSSSCFGQRVLELKEQGFGEEEAMAVADVSYQFIHCGWSGGVGCRG